MTDCSIIRKLFSIAFAVLLLSSSRIIFGEDGSAAWLRYAPLSLQAKTAACSDLPGHLFIAPSTDKDDLLLKSAEVELSRGTASMCGRKLTLAPAFADDDTVVLGTLDSLATQISWWHPPSKPSTDGYVTTSVYKNNHHYIIVAGANSRGTLYGTFALLTRIAEGKHPFSSLRPESPASTIRWVNQWDNMDGSIERGYAGRSIFFDGGHVRTDLHRAGDFARLLASVGINGCAINNVNADPKILTAPMIDEISRVADEFRPWGVQLSLSVDFSSPEVIGGLSTFDPLDPKVIAWWNSTAENIYKKIPDFGGFVVKADSEGKPGPSQYGRSPAEAANMLADAVKPHGGLVLYRGFVYNHHLDWHDLKADRAKAGVDNFGSLDGKFRDNVVIQIKNGPIDFQVREPASPLFAALRHTNQAIELQITQEYLGQQRHLVYLPPMWKTTLDTDMRVDDRPSTVKQIVTGKSFHRKLGGFIGVANVGLDANWLSHPLAMANLYGFARLAWDPDLSSAEIVSEWTRLTFGNDKIVDRTIDDMQLASWKLYEDYTGPLGLGTLTDIIGTHYGPGIASAEDNGWGQWLRADQKGIGMDRTIATGTGYIGQYPPQLAKIYESLATCPDNLLLFMHHVSYSHQLHSGKTVIQYVYDSHYAGAAGAAHLAVEWKAVNGRIDAERYKSVLQLLNYQAGHAIVWRDAVTNWFMQMSSIPDALHRVGNYPDRAEAESMKLEGYKVVAVNPVETASGGKAIECFKESCEASIITNRASGRYRLAVEYFDLHDGESTYVLAINGMPVAHWRADNTLPTNKLNGSTSTRFTLSTELELKPGDVITITGKPQQPELAPIDYISITRASSLPAKRPVAYKRGRRRP